MKKWIHVPIWQDVGDAWMGSSNVHHERKEVARRIASDYIGSNTAQRYPVKKDGHSLRPMEQAAFEILGKPDNWDQQMALDFWRGVGETASMGEDAVNTARHALKHEQWKILGKFFYGVQDNCPPSGGSAEYI